jgi:hypothetical protein
MAVAHQITDKAAILRNFTGSLPIAHTGGLNDGIISTHGINEPDKTFI